MTRVVLLLLALQELQRLSQQAITSEVALQQLRNDLQQLNTGQQQLATRVEVGRLNLSPAWETCQEC